MLITPRFTCRSSTCIWFTITVLFTTLLFDINGLQAQTIDLSTLSSNLEKISTLSGEFKQENVDSLQDRLTSASGRFFFMKPGLMQWIYDKPDPYRIIVGSRKIWIFDPVLETVTIHNAKKIKGFKILSMLFEPEKLQSHFKSYTPLKILLRVESNDKLLFLIHKEPDPNIVEIQIAFNAEYLIKQFVVVDRNRNYRRIIFSKLNVKPRINASIFEFQIPEGVEIIDKTTEYP